jgi:X-X-X-Leu-X-X-Gly heptad repeat protein
VQTLNAGVQTLNAGVQTLNAGVQTLNAGVQTLKKNTLRTEGVFFVERIKGFEIHPRQGIF